MRLVQLGGGCHLRSSPVACHHYLPSVRSVINPGGESGTQPAVGRSPHVRGSHVRAGESAVSGSDAPRRRGRPGHDQDAVLNAAVRLFNERGYDATSMFDIAESLGITKSSVYHHISGKEQLLQMAMDRALDGLFEAAEEVGDLDLPALDRLERLIRRSVIVLAERFEFVTVLLRVRGNTAVEQHALV